ncbi:hypothetical protein [Streptomyces sp. ME18-1-4]|uniref:hypothetical protein n=1 Tax=Streptomyces sp. ME18-1-4 TaxID=3028685 RepID=UPI0029A938FB|nr:hypothetical protein [Streptomyces sp. ME18-1-4]MDX3248861.1 hypothetical protein [Streptomyces sp. ME18-1-4]
MPNTTNAVGMTDAEGRTGGPDPVRGPAPAPASRSAHLLGRELIGSRGGLKTPHEGRAVAATY